MPTSFDEALMTEWSLWVLDHGLPALPTHVSAGESVPIAYWVGPVVAAVMHVGAVVDPERDAPMRFDDEIECFRRVADRWEVADGGGGSNWPFGAALTRVDVPHDFVGFSGELTATGDGLAVTAVDGYVGIDAAWIEVIDATGVARRRVDAPLGVILVALADVRPATLRVLDKHENEMCVSVL